MTDTNDTDKNNIDINDVDKSDLTDDSDNNLTDIINMDQPDNTISLVVDDREQQMIPLLESNINNYIDKTVKAANIDYVVRRFNVGDYLIIGGGKLLAVLERKTFKDYAASFKDGRHMNKQKLLEIREKTNCDLYYIIEGPIRPDIKTKYANIPYKNILTSINNLRIRDKIQIIKTTNKEHTIEELGFLTHCYSKLFEELTHIKTGGVEELESIKLSPEQHMENSIRKAWQTVHFVSDAFATVLMKKYKIKNMLLCDYDDELTKLKLPSGRTPSSVAFDNLKNSIYIGSITEKIISNCPGISLASAKIILTQTTPGNLAIMSLNDMKKLKKGKTNLGKNADKLYNFINN